MPNSRSTMMGWFSMILAGLVLWMPAGCRSSSSAPAGAPNAPRAVSAPTATPAPTSGLRLKSGVAPLSYLLASGGSVRIVDVTSSSKIAETAAAPQALIQIDQEKGISMSGKVLKPGPLPQGHRYEIWLDRK